MDKSSTLSATISGSIYRIVKVHPTQLRCINIDLWRLKTAFLVFLGVSFLLIVTGITSHNMQGTQAVAPIAYELPESKNPENNSPSEENLHSKNEPTPEPPTISRIFAPGYPEIFLLTSDGSIFSVLSDGSTVPISE